MGYIQSMANKKIPPCKIASCVWQAAAKEDFYIQLCYKTTHQTNPLYNLN